MYDPPLQREIELGLNAETAGRSAEALQHYDAALTIADQRGIGDAITALASSISSIASAEGGKGNLSVLLTAATILAKHPRSGRDGSYALSKLGSIEAYLGRPTEALRHYQDALALDRQSGNCESQAANLAAIGIIEASLGNHEDALRAEWTALGLYRKTKPDPNRSDCDIKTEIRYDTPLNRIGEAPFLFGVAVAEERGSNHEAALACALTALADYQVPLTGPLAASAHSAPEGVTDPGGYAKTLALIGDIQYHLHAFTDARSSALRAAALDRKYGLSAWQALRVAGHAEAELDHGEPETNCVSRATASYDAAVDDIERQRAALTAEGDRKSFFAQTIPVFDEYVAYLLRLDQAFPKHGCSRKAFEIFERRLARAFREQIAQSIVRSVPGIPQDVVDRQRGFAVHIFQLENSLAEEYLKKPVDASVVAALGAALNEARSNQTALEEDIKAHYRALYDLQHPVASDLKAISSRLYPDEIMLVYDLLPAESALWIVGRDRFQFVRLPGSHVLEDAVVAVHRHIEAADGSTASADLAGFARDSNALYQRLIPKAVPMLGGTQHLIVVPSGALLQFPFEALVTRPPSVGSRAPHYLIQDVPISYIPSASLLGLVRGYPRRESAPRALFAVAPFAEATAQRPAAQIAVERSAYATLQLGAMLSALKPRGLDRAQAFPQLPGTQTEVDKVRDVLEAPADSTLIRDAATRQRVLAMNSSGYLKTVRYLLFATHAVLFDQTAGLTEPAIVLAHPENGDGFLTMGDVLGLSLNADFVALSACYTGVVSEPHGDGISGLTRAFLFAGASAISVTLWQVDDAAGPRISPAFFAAMRAGKSSAEALRQAQIAMIESGDPAQTHPYEWAPFVIFGDGDLIGARGARRRAPH